MMWQALSVAAERLRARSTEEHRGRAGYRRFVVVARGQEEEDSDGKEEERPRGLAKSVSCEVGVPRTLTPNP